MPTLLVLPTMAHSFPLEMTGCGISWFSLTNLWLNWIRLSPLDIRHQFWHQACPSLASRFPSPHCLYDMATLCVDGCPSLRKTVFLLFKTSIIFVFLFNPSLTTRLYSEEDPVVILTSATVKQTLVNSSTAWLVQFYSSWCGHCIQYSPTWKALAGDVKGESYGYLAS